MPRKGKIARKAPKHLVALRLVFRRVMFKLFRYCGMRNMIILLLISLMLAYLFSYDRWFSVVMGFCMNAVTSSTMLAQPVDEDLGEWEIKIRKLSLLRCEKKKKFLKSVNCFWRLDGIDWYSNDYFFKRLKYVLYYEEYFALLGSRNMCYKLVLADITSSCCRKFSMIIPVVTNSQVLVFFSHENFDEPTRSKRLQASLYVTLYKAPQTSCVYAMKYIADYSGVLVSPRMIFRLRRNSRGFH
jgi:hypothetical protein